MKGTRRFLRAYRVTFQVVASYLWVRFWGRFRSPQWLEAALARAHVRNARRAEKAILSLQGLFIKAGQLISIMTNFLPQEFRAGLEGLQDQVPPRPLDQIRQRFIDDFGNPPEDLFRRFDAQPMASASIAQVHPAQLPDGTEVAVKVQHHELDRLVTQDLRTIRRILSIVQLFLPVRGMESFYREFRLMIEREMNFLEEAQALARISCNFKPEQKVRFPRVFPEFSSRRVLTTEYIEGVKIGDIPGLEAMGLDRPVLARRVVEAYCQMIFVDGEYHADPHPGNLLVQNDGTVVFLDFGAVARLSPGMRKGMADFFAAVVKRDTERIIAALRSMGFLAHGTNSEEVSERVIEHFHRRFQEEVHLESFNLKDIRLDPQMGFDSLMDLSRMDIGLRELTAAFIFPKEWVLLERTVLLLTGVCSQLDPQMNPTAIVKPYLESFVLGKDREWADVLLDAGKDTFLAYLALPAEIRRFTAKAIRGELSLRQRGLRQGFRLMYAVGHQVIYTAASIALAAGGLVLYRDGTDSAALACWAGAAWFGLMTAASMAWARRYIPRR